MALARRWLAVLALTALAGCATVEAPILELDRIGRARVGITGAQLEVVFLARNPNPYEMLVEQFDYELILNGRRIGRGFAAEPIPLPPFGSAPVLSRIDIGMLRLPGAVRRVLDEDRVKARAKGHFWVRERGDVHKLGFNTEARIDLR